MTISGRVAALLNLDQTNPLDLASGSFPLANRKLLEFANGTGANQADVLWSDRRTLAASATDSLDLAAGALVDAFGATVSFARVRMMFIAAAAMNVNTVTVAPAAVNGWSTWAGAAGDKVILRPNGMLLLAAPDATGYAVTAGTGDLLEVANGGAGSAVTYDIVLLGASA